jgi:hypothetical protein
MARELGPTTLSEIAAPSTPSTGLVELYAKSDGLVYAKDDAGNEYLLTHAVEAYAWSMEGVITTKTGALRVYCEFAGVIESVRASVSVAPTGASILVDINKNGTTIYGTQGNRPTIAASGFTGVGGTASGATVAAGDYITVDIDQIGSTVAGSNLTVVVRIRRTA